MLGGGGVGLVVSSAPHHLQAGSISQSAFRHSSMRGARLGPFWFFRRSFPVLFVYMYLESGSCESLAEDALSALPKISYLVRFSLVFSIELRSVQLLVHFSTPRHTLSSCQVES